MLFNKTDYNRFILKFFRKSKLKSLAFNQYTFSDKTGHVFLKLLDVHGEVLLKKSNS